MPRPGLTHAEARMLTVVALMGPITKSKVARACGVWSDRAKAGVEHLVELGLVKVTEDGKLSTVAAAHPPAVRLELEPGTVASSATSELAEAP